MFCTQLTPPAWAASFRQMTSTMPAKARNNKTPMWQTLLAVAFWVAVWQGLAVCIGHNGLFLATPLQTVQTLWRLLPTADFWHRVGFSALRILTGFVLAVTVGLLLGACGARWRWFGTLGGAGYAVDPRHASGELCHSGAAVGQRKKPFGHCQLYPCAAGCLCGYGGRHCRYGPGPAGNGKGLSPAAGQAAAVYLAAGDVPVLLRKLHCRMGMCWKSGVSAEVIGLPDHSVGDALYRAKITISTPEVFAWTLVIVLLSATLSTLAAWRYAAPSVPFAGRWKDDQGKTPEQSLWQYSGFAGSGT